MIDPGFVYFFGLELEDGHVPTFFCPTSNHAVCNSRAFVWERPDSEQPRTAKPQLVDPSSQQVFMRTSLDVAEVTLKQTPCHTQRLQGGLQSLILIPTLGYWPRESPHRGSLPNPLRARAKQLRTQAPSRHPSCP